MPCRRGPRAKLNYTGQSLTGVSVTLPISRDDAQR